MPQSRSSSQMGRLVLVAMIAALGGLAVIWAGAALKTDVARPNLARQSESTVETPIRVFRGLPIQELILAQSLSTRAPLSYGQKDTLAPLVAQSPSSTRAPLSYGLDDTRAPKAILSPSTEPTARGSPSPTIPYVGKPKHVMDCKKPSQFLARTDFEGVALTTGATIATASADDCCRSCSARQDCQYAPCLSE